MSELSDYKLFVEAPAIRSYEATINSLRAEIEKLQSALSVTQEEGRTEIARLEAEVEKLKAERDEAQEAADNAPWPQWADDIRKKLMEFGYDAGSEGEWNIGESFEDWMDGTFGEYERQKDAEITRLTSQLEQAETILADLAKQIRPDLLDRLSDNVMFEFSVRHSRAASQWIKDRQSKGEG